ncbi:MAG: Gfo/Idh/MocA family oxidoreductase [Nitrospirae bacterium]|nr:Gfo/Idh/MocA family oxidoreductase [Nitrospirota bacterium]
MRTQEPGGVDGTASPVRVAVRGTGTIGLRHLEVIRRMGEAVPVAVPRRKERRTELLALGLETASDLQEAAREGAKIAVIATDTGCHYEDGWTALETGMDVLIEKPLAEDAPRSEALRRRAVNLGRSLFIGNTLRFCDSLNAFRRILPRIGDLHSVRIECQSYLPDWRPARPYRSTYSAREGEGGVLRDLIHEIDYAGWLYGWPAHIQAKLKKGKQLGIESEESADLLWEAPGGWMVSLTLDYVTRPWRRMMRAHGSEGTIEWDGLTGTTAVSRVGEDRHVTTFPQAKEDMLLAQDRAFVNGGKDPGASAQLATANEGVKALAVCDAARRSSRTGREERIEYP